MSAVGVTGRCLGGIWAAFQPPARPDLEHWAWWQIVKLSGWDLVGAFFEDRAWLSHKSCSVVMTVNCCFVFLKVKVNFKKNRFKKTLKRVSKFFSLILFVFCQLNYYVKILGHLFTILDITLYCLSLKENCAVQTNSFDKFNWKMVIFGS